MRNKLFSTKDPLGNTSHVVRNFNNHIGRKTHAGSWGADEHARKLFPRGKAYDRLWELQFERFMSNYDYF